MLFGRRQPEPLGARLRTLVWPRRSFRRSLRYLGKRLLRIRASPHAIAAGFACGVFASFTPFLGLHILLAFALAFLLGGNMAAAALGTLVGNPVTFPLIWGSTYELGRWLLHSEHVEVSEPEGLGQALMGFDFSAVWKPLIEPMLVGALPIGLTAALAGYVAMFLASRSFRRGQVATAAGRAPGAARIGNGETAR